jgi:uncharacterized membrane protein
MGWFPPQEFYSIFTGTLHNMFWMKISKRTPKKKKKKKTWLSKMVLAQHFLFVWLSRYNSTYIIRFGKSHLQSLTHGLDWLDILIGPSGLLSTPF